MAITDWLDIGQQFGRSLSGYGAPQRGGLSGSDRDNVGYISAIDRMFKGVNPTDDISISRVTQRLASFNSQYGNRFNEEAIQYLTETQNKLSDFKLDNAAYKTGYQEVLDIDNKAKEILKLNLDDPNLDATIDANYGTFMDNMSKWNQKALEFESRFSSRLSSSPFLRQSIADVKNTLADWRISLGTELSRAADINMDTFNVIMNNPEAYNAFRSQKVNELAGVRGNIENQIDLKSAEFETLKGQYTMGKMQTQLPGGALSYVDIPRETLNEIYSNMLLLKKEIDPLNIKWSNSWYWKADQPFYFDTELPGVIKRGESLDAIKQKLRSGEYKIGNVLSENDILGVRQYLTTDQENELRKEFQVGESTTLADTTLSAFGKKRAELKKPRTPGQLALYHADVFNEIIDMQGVSGYYGAEEVYSRINTATDVSKQDKYIAYDKIMKNLTKDRKFTEDDKLLALTNKIYKAMGPLLGSFTSTFKSVLTRQYKEYGKSIKDSRVGRPSKAQDVTERKKIVDPMDITAMRPQGKLNLAQIDVTKERTSLGKLLTGLPNKDKMEVSKLIHQSWLKLPAKDRDSLKTKELYTKSLIDTWDVDLDTFKSDEEMSKAFADYIRSSLVTTL